MVELSGQRTGTTLPARPSGWRRLAAYRALIVEQIVPLGLDAIREHLQLEHPNGSDRFREKIEREAGRCPGPTKTGRTRKACRTLKMKMHAARICRPEFALLLICHNNASNLSRQESIE